ncbi:MAG: beta-lactamase family protein, partial [Bacteroidales bacterium]|nr:beta-lactamase family protein [Bacteroidales bacterium]
MKAGKFILILVGAAGLIAAFPFIVRGRAEKKVPEAPVYVADLNSAIVNEDIPELKAMDHAIDSFMNFWSLKGASLAIMRNDSLLYAKGYGKADSTTPMTPGTTMRLASVSKLLTAVGIMKLQEEGKVFLDTPVFGPFGVLNEYDSYIKDNNYYLITVEHLLRHQAGFSVRGGDVMFSKLTFMRDWGLSEPPTPQFVVQKQLGRRLAFEPGTWQEYSNFGFLLLSLIIEKVSGEPYDQYMQEHVFAPAGCTQFRIGGNYLKDRLPGESQYFMQPDSEPVPSFDGKYSAVDKCYGGNDITGLMGAGAWTASAVEMARLVGCIDGRGPMEDILSEESIRKMTTWYDADTFSLGWNDTKPDGEW